MHTNKIVAALAAAGVAGTLLLGATIAASAADLEKQWCDRYDLPGRGSTDLCRSQTTVRGGYIGALWMKDSATSPHLSLEDRTRFSVQTSAEGNVTTKFTGALGTERRDLGPYRRTRLLKVRLCHALGTEAEKCTAWR